jgi:hypothetical protein
MNLTHNINNKQKEQKMLNKTSNFVATLLITLIITAGVSFAQEDSSKSHINHDHKMEMKKDDHKHMDQNKMMGSENKEMMDDSKSMQRLMKTAMVKFTRIRCAGMLFPIKPETALNVE